MKLAWRGRVGADLRASGGRSAHLDVSGELTLRRPGGEFHAAVFEFGQHVVEEAVALGELFGGEDAGFGDLSGGDHAGDDDGGEGGGAGHG